MPSSQSSKSPSKPRTSSREAPRMERPDAEVLARVEAVMAVLPVYRRAMFGTVAWWLERNAQMLGCVWGVDLNVRVGEVEAQRLVASGKARPFEPMAGRPMREYVLVPASTLRPAALKRWIVRAIEFTETLAAKQGK
ncbi:MAG: hypothetical protein EXR64_03660 [Dehalococcoidia bacterium]|nr:hypothetical protein [Dehalococcoidia bacterium]